MTTSAQTHNRNVDEYSMARERMVRILRDEYGINDERVLSAMEEIPRHQFVPEAFKFQAYRNNALPISGNQTISQPLIVARMTEMLQLNGSAKVLEIGTGSGYQTAILAALSRKVFSIERVAELAKKAEKRLSGFRNVTIKCDDGTNGWEAYSPYDRILVTAGSPVAPEPLLSQLEEGGVMVVPVGEEKNEQKLVRITRTGGSIKRKEFGACSFVPLIGDHGWQD